MVNSNLPAAVSSILVVRLGAMGDIIHALPAAASLKHSFPRAKVTWVVEKHWVPLLEGNGFVDRIVVFHRREPSTWAATRQELRSQKYDLAVDFQGLIKSALIAHMSAPEKIVGYGRGAVRERPAGWFYSARTEVSAVHVVEKGLELARFAGASNLVRVFPLPSGKAEQPLPSEPFVLASPLAGWTSKQWPLEYWARLAELLKDRLRMPLVLDGAPGTIPAIPHTLPHESSVQGLLHVTRKAAVVVGVDSGPLHLAAALGKSGVAIFGPTDPARNGPYGGDFTVLRHPGSHTTHRRGKVIDPSMRAITPEQVFQAIETAIPCPA